jgi:hypothetical protein
MKRDWIIGWTVETVADGMAPHPASLEAIKGAGLVALGRPIDVPNGCSTRSPGTW